jgi:hypothetical protein
LIKRLERRLTEPRDSSMPKFFGTHLQNRALGMGASRTFGHAGPDSLRDALYGIHCLRT